MSVSKSAVVEAVAVEAVEVSGGGGKKGGVPSSSSGVVSGEPDVFCLVFRGVNKESVFRLILTPTSPSSTTIWAESVRSKNQWQLDVVDVNTHGPLDASNGSLPPAVVYRYLRQAFEALQASQASQSQAEGGAAAAAAAAGGEASAGGGGGEEASIDAALTLEGLLLSLSFCVVGLSFVYEFKLAQKRVETKDVVESKIRDTEEELERLRREVVELKARVSTLEARPTTFAVMYLCSKNKDPPYCSKSSMRWTISWIMREFFDLSADTTTITIKKSGFYAFKFDSAQGMQHTICIGTPGGPVSRINTQSNWCHSYSHSEDLKHFPANTTIEVEETQDGGANMVFTARLLCEGDEDSFKP